MTQPPNRDLECWRPPQSPFQILYSRWVLEQIRLAVVDAYFLVPRGGLEIGGVLLGKYRDRHVEVLEHEPLNCEHAFGPSFSLSPRDQDRLKDLLLKARHRSGGLEPVGWYHSHTRSEICLTQSDLDIHDRYFPEMWQIALVLRPSAAQLARAGFFFRELGGSIHAAASYHEFKLEPVRARPALLQTEADARVRLSHGDARAADPVIAVPPPESRPRASERILRSVLERRPGTTSTPPPALQAVPAPAAASRPPREQRLSRERPPSASPQPPGERPVPLTPQASPAPERQPPPTLVERPAPEYGAAPVAEPQPRSERQTAAIADPAPPQRRSVTTESSLEPASVPTAVKRVDPAGVELPRFLRNEPPPQSAWTRVPLFIFAMLFLVVALGGFVFVAHDALMPPLRAIVARVSPRPARAAPVRIGPAMSISAVDNFGQLQIRWDTGSPSVEEARSAALSIMDGGPPQRIPLDAPHLQAGAFTYKRRGPRVDARLSIVTAEGGSVETATTFLGPPIVEEAAPSNVSAAALAKQNARLRRQLDEQIARNKSLQAQLDRIRKRAAGPASPPVNLR